MADPNKVNRRTAMGRCAAVAGSAYALSKAAEASAAGSDEAKGDGMLYGKLGDVKMSRMMLGGNLVSGYMHARDLKYVNRLFRAYVNEEKIFETFQIAEENGINTVLESGANLVYKYNKERGGKMLIIPSIHPDVGHPRQAQAEIAKKVDDGCAALYIWGSRRRQAHQAPTRRPDRRSRRTDEEAQHSYRCRCPLTRSRQGLRRTGDSLRFYVKTLHQDNYFTATPEPLRKEYIWLDGAKAGTTACGASTRKRPSSTWPRSRSPGSLSRSWRPAPFCLVMGSPMLSTAAPISSASACSTSRSKRTARPSIASHDAPTIVHAPGTASTTVGGA